MPANCAGASGPFPASPATASTDTSTPFRETSLNPDSSRNQGLRHNPKHIGHICTDIAADLTRRAGDDPAWWGVVRQYALGHARWPDPFQPRKPKPRT